MLNETTPSSKDIAYRNIDIFDVLATATEKLVNQGITPEEAAKLVEKFASDMGWGN